MQLINIIIVRIITFCGGIIDITGEEIKLLNKCDKLFGGFSVDLVQSLLK